MYIVRNCNKYDDEENVCFMKKKNACKYFTKCIDEYENEKTKYLTKNRFETHRGDYVEIIEMPCYDDTDSLVIDQIRKFIKKLLDKDEIKKYYIIINELVLRSNDIPISMMLIDKIEIGELKNSEVINYIEDIISKDNDENDEDSYKLTIDDYAIYKWLINETIYYDICQESKYDAEIGHLVNFDSALPKLICTLDEGSVTPCIKKSKYNEKMV